jgi:hypothetical protein
VAGGEGFEPSTPNLGGWCSLRAVNERTLDPTILGVNPVLTAIRTELLAQTNNKTLHEPHIQTLLRIEQLLTYLEGEDKCPNTVLAYKKNLYAVAIRADLNNPTSVALAIARYKCIDPKTRKLVDRPASITTRANSVIATPRIILVTSTMNLAKEHFTLVIRPSREVLSSIQRGHNPESPKTCHDSSLLPFRDQQAHSRQSSKTHSEHRNARG